MVSRFVTDKRAASGSAIPITSSVILPRVGSSHLGLWIARGLDGLAALYPGDVNIAADFVRAYASAYSPIYTRYGRAVELRLL